MNLIKSAVLTVLAFATGSAPALQPASPTAPPLTTRPPTPEQPAPPPPPPPPQYVVPAWASPEAEKIGAMLTGSWRTAAPVAEHGSADATTDLWMHIKPISVNGLDSTLYVELARADAAHRPYRQAIYQIYTYKGKSRLRTFEFRSRDPGSMTGLWLAPQFFPQIAASELIATVDIDLEPSGKGYRGKTPYPYPTGLLGAVEMVSELQITADSIITKDRGYDAAGTIVWGSSDKDSYTFTKGQPPVTAEVRENGLIVIRMVAGEPGKAIATGDRVAMHYTGWFPATGKQFDSSRPINRPLIYNQGVKGVPEGISQGMEGAVKGEVRRLLVPWQLAYGAAGNSRFPPYSNIIFESEVMAIETPETPATPPAAAPTGSPPGQK